MSFGSTATLTRSLDHLVLDHERRPPGADRGDLLAQARVIRREAEILNLPALAGVAALREGELLLATGDARGALGVLEQSVGELDGAGATDLLAVAMARISEALVATGAMRTALDVCAHGIDLVERDRDKTSAAYMQASYLRRTISLYANGVRAAHELGDARMLTWIELSKGRVPPAARAGGRPGDMRERLAELGERIDRCRSSGDTEAEAALRVRRRALYDRLLGLERGAGPAFDLDAVQAALAAGQRAVSYYWIDPARLLVVVVTPAEVVTELRHVTADERAALDELAGRVIQSGSVDYDVPTTFLDPVIERISALLLPDAARDADRLLVAAHRTLHTVPFLMLPIDGRPLVRRMAVAAIPNLTCLQAGASEPASRRVLAVGVNDYAEPGAGPLPEAEAAAGEIAALYAAQGFAAESLLGAEATEDALRSRLDSPPACLHLTLHGASVESDIPLESWLVLARSRLDGLDLVDWQLAGATVVLASCSSGQRAIAGRGMNELPGDDVFGLQAAFFSAGARQLLSALWPVDFRVARPVTRAFHRALIAGRPADVALRVAIEDHLDSASVLHRDSTYWAPFTLTAVGAPQSIKEPA